MRSPTLFPHSRVISFWVFGLSLIGLLLAYTLRDVRLWEPGSGLMLSVHLVLELFLVVVAALVVVMAWHAFKVEDLRVANTLILTFTLVMAMDFFHALSYAGMPDLGSPSSTSKAIFFWFAGRGIELLGLWLVVLRVSLPGSRMQWQWLGLAGVGLLFILGTWRLDWFPETFVEGEGVTDFKTAVEWLLCLGYLAAVPMFWREAARDAALSRKYYYAAACFAMGVGDLTFTSYVSAGDALVIYGHVFKVAAYALIYFATFESGLKEPYVLLLRSEDALREKQVELETVLSQVPAGVARIDAEGRFAYVNAQFAKLLGKPASAIERQSFDKTLPKQHRASASYHWAKAMTGASSMHETEICNDVGQELHLSTWISPARTGSGDIVGALAVVMDTTEPYRLRSQLNSSTEEIRDLKKALDAHAIVAITDARGVITSVNDKFCEISKYSRTDLIGNTHALINSGHHSKEFFQDLWRTISSGKVWFGEVCNRAKDGSLYWVSTTIVPYSDDNSKPVRYVAIRADITERKRIEQKVEKMAYQDPLTGLPNRRLLMDRLHQSVQLSERTGQYGALLLLDLDHFKDVNDTLGHDQGDHLLRQVSERLIACVRQTDMVARLGGDEFVVLLTNLGLTEEEASTQAGRISEQMLYALSETYRLDRATITTSSSVGVVLFHGQEVSPPELLKQADLSLYQAKGAGRKVVRFFDPAIQKAFQNRLQLEDDLRNAMARDQFKVFYQPIVNHLRQIVAVEALLRWQHPVKGLTSPAVFIPILESTGLISEVGRWVIHQACALLQAWSTHPERSTLEVAVNVSAKQFRQTDFVEQTVALLDQFHVGAGLLKLEVTESSLQDDLANTIEKMQRLRDHGVRFAIDDFGTGYSSLSYLKALPIHVLKIDRSFVLNVDKDADAAAIAKTILDLAHNMGLETVAEGVESDAQLQALIALGCSKFQGYLFGRPGLVEALECSMGTGHNAPLTAGNSPANQHTSESITHA